MNKSDKILKKHFLNQIIAPLAFSFSLLVMGYFIIKPAVKDMVIKERQEAVQDMVNSIYNLLEGYNQQIQRGELTLAQAQFQAINNIKYLYYGKNRSNYFWILDYQGHSIYHPYFKSPTIRNNNISRSGKKIAQQITQLIKKQNEGYISYNWYLNQKNSSGNLKKTYFKGYKPWSWVICTGFMLTDIENDLHQLIKKVLIILFFFLGGLLLILSFVLFRNYRNLQKIMITDIELDKSEARFRGLVEHIDNGMMIIENEKPVFANGKFGQIFDLKGAEMLHFNLEDYLPGWEKERVRIILNTESQNQITEFSTWLQLTDQTEKFVNLSIRYDTDNNIDYKYLVIQDLTEQKHSITTIDILSENLTQSRESIMITNLNGIIEYVNPGFEKVSGYTFEEVKGKNPRLLKSNKMSPIVYEDLWKTILGGEIWTGELLNKKKDGSLFWESTIIFPIKNKQNEIIKYSSIKTDISHNKRIEKELLAAKDKAEENERFKIAFLKNVSHEVRTPLNAIYGFTQLLKNDLESNETILSYLKIIEKNSQILLHLFEDILDVSSIESRSVILQKEDVPLKDLLLKIVSKYNVQLTIMESKPVEIIVDHDNNFETMVLFTDRKRITQIFDKLLSNSVKFTNKGHIKISYDIQPENIIFYISDTGVGIPDKENELIFDNFSHGDNLYVSLHKGVGLGLNIAKMLVELLGGKLDFTSEEKKGTTFSFTIPSTDLKNYHINGKEVHSYKHSVQGKNILIAEDNDENFKYLEALLAPQNYLMRAKTGVEVLTLMEIGNVLPDIILMDILMPEMDGIAASRLIRKKHSSIPIIAITAIGLALTGAENTLFNAVFTKPVSAQKLLRKIYEMLEEK